MCAFGSVFGFYIVYFFAHCGSDNSFFLFLKNLENKTLKIVVPIAELMQSANTVFTIFLSY